MRNKVVKVRRNLKLVFEQNRWGYENLNGRSGTFFVFREDDRGQYSASLQDAFTDETLAYTRNPDKTCLTEPFEQETIDTWARTYL